MELNAAQTLAETYLTQYKLTAWKFQFDHAKKRFGSCNYTHKRITLSRHLVQLNSLELVKDTLLHEIAHALVGPRHAHDALWQTKARELGCKPRATFNSEVKTPSLKYTATCPFCGTSHQIQKIPRRPVACATCCRLHNSGKYHPSFRLTFSKNY